MNRLLAAFEAQIRRSAKDEGEARRKLDQLAAEPPEVRRKRVAELRAGRAAGSARGRMTAEDADALVARLAAADAMYG